MSREVHVRFYEGLAGQFRRSTHLIAHCVSEQQAEWLKAKIKERLSQCGLALHPQKTRVVYCRDDAQKDKCQTERFDFLGYTFRPRELKSRAGHYFMRFCPAISDTASSEICRVIRSWRIHRCNGMSLDEISRFCNPILRGWINYYGQYYKSALTASLKMDLKCTREHPVGDCQLLRLHDPDETVHK
jgi:RNA-directed DNA polymerase